MHFNWQKFSGISELLSFSPQFLVKNAKKNRIFLRKRVLSVVFIELKGRWLQTGLADLIKHQTSVFFLRVNFFFAFLKISHFSRFLKIIGSTC